ncbi:MAG: exonuclease domain-containing protein [Alphaproteobacteria bacterium]|nr:exonuclease domain-containing protein [Alphaproteobacteria bacterium]
MFEPRYFLVVDLEATCDDKNRLPREQMETIEIGAVLVDRDRDYAAIDEYMSFVRPIRHPRLTEFCTQLTSITQAQVDSAPLFPVAFEGLLQRAWVGIAEEAVFCSWGNFDAVQFQRDCRLHGVEYPFGVRHYNLKKLFSEQQRTRRRYGMAGALRAVGLPLEGTHHRGIDDARNIARLLPWCLGLRPFEAPEET